MTMSQPGIRLLFLIALLTGLAAMLVSLSPSADLSPPPEEGHRSLRDNPAGPAPDPVPPSEFSGYPGAPDFAVESRSDALSHYPCADCHAHMPANPERRKLFSPHPGVLDHGDGRFWCLDCHDAEDRNQLATLAGESVGFDQADEVCSQCHYAVHRDWTFGAHGKRVAGWQGERTVYGCAHCHNPHDPALRPRAPEKPPAVRVGLEPMPDTGDHSRVFPWLPKDREDEDEQDAR